MSQTVKWSESHDVNLCPECKVDYRSFVENVRREAWDRLPSIVGPPFLGGAAGIRSAELTVRLGKSVLFFF